MHGRQFKEIQRSSFTDICRKSLDRYASIESYSMKSIIQTQIDLYQDYRILYSDLQVFSDFIGCYLKFTIDSEDLHSQSYRHYIQIQSRICNS